MKKQLLSFALVLISLGAFSQASTIWMPHNSNFDTTWGIRWMSCPSANTAWALGYDGWHTTAVSNKFSVTNNGGTFVPGTFMPDADTNYYNSASISAVNDSVAYVPCYFIPGTGRAGLMFKTMDRGLNWTICTDTNTMFLGASNFPDWARFWDNNHGLVMGDPNGGYFEMYRTWDGGSNWTRVPQTAFTPSLTPSGEYGLTDSYTWYGNKHIWFGTGHSSSAVPHVYRSNDTGHTWLSATVPGMLGGVNGLAFRDSLNGMCWGLTSTTNGKFLLKRTSDGGITWQTVFQHDMIGTSDISVVPGRNAYISVGIDSSSAAAGGIVGNGIMTTVTYDDGATWQILESAPGGAGANVYRMLQVTMIDSSHGWGGTFSDNTNIPFGSNGMNTWMGQPIALGCPLYVTGLNSICSGTAVTLTGHGAGTYTWSANAGSVTTSTASITPSATDTYTLMATGGSACTNTVTYNVVVTPTPTAAVTSSNTNDTLYNTNCGMTPNTATLTATGGTTYSWLPGTGLSSTSIANPVASANSFTNTTTNTYTVTAHNGSCTNTATISVVYISCAGVNEFNVNGTSISYYPNPSSGKVNVEMTHVKAGTVLTVSDLLGNQVYKTTMNTNALNQTIELDLTTMPKGVYLLGVSNGNQSRVQKLIVE